MAGTEVLAYVSRVRGVELAPGRVDHDSFTLAQVESNPVRCPDQESADLMYKGAGVCGCVDACCCREPACTA